MDPTYRRTRIHGLGYNNVAELAPLTRTKFVCEAIFYDVMIFIYLFSCFRSCLRDTKKNQSDKNPHLNDSTELENLFKRQLICH